MCEASPAYRNPLPLAGLREKVVRGYTFITGSLRNKKWHKMNPIIKIINRGINNSDNTNNFVSVFPKFYEYLDSLTLLQEISLLHICMFCVLILTVFNISAVLFGNEMIRIFNLEGRFPRLAMFFRLRVTLQRYYLVWNVLILFVFCLFGIGINLLFFTVK